jgi:hypothetical protein
VILAQPDVSAIPNRKVPLEYRRVPPEPDRGRAKGNKKAPATSGRG